MAKPFPWLRPQEHKCLKGDDTVETMVPDADPELKQLQDRPADLGNELIETNLAEEGKDAQPLFIALVCLMSLSRHTSIC